MNEFDKHVRVLTTDDGDVLIQDPSWGGTFIPIPPEHMRLYPGKESAVSLGIPSLDGRQIQVVTLVVRADQQRLPERILATGVPIRLGDEFHESGICFEFDADDEREAPLDLAEKVRRALAATSQDDLPDSSEIAGFLPTSGTSHPGVFAADMAIPTSPGSYERGMMTSNGKFFSFESLVKIGRTRTKDGPLFPVFLEKNRENRRRLLIRQKTFSQTRHLPECEGMSVEYWVKDERAGNHRMGISAAEFVPQRARLNVRFLKGLDHPNEVFVTEGDVFSSATYQSRRKGPSSKKSVATKKRNLRVSGT